MQKTISHVLEFEGHGLHSGHKVRARILPAPVDTGIWFRRTDEVAGDNQIAASWDNVRSTRLCTALANRDGTEVSTVEHVMAALAGCGINNAIVEVDRPELPILDGSAANYVASILTAGVTDQDKPLHVIEVLQEVIVEDGSSWAMLAPSPGFQIEFGIEFADAAIGTQHKLLDMANGAFVRELSDCRTFCTLGDVEDMHAAGLAKGGNMQNALVVDGDDILTPGGARRADEAVRHKMLDALGDLALAGAPLRGKFSAFKGGHAMTNRLLRALFAQPGAFAWRQLGAADLANLPGIGVSQADMPAVA